ncbi:EVE domain-containing protein [Pseudoruegeria sp. HB172150]|uniref:EVE domain-containing protein n=1 Tax=Pseudoruegeria sp. HB172150 TaxID=2721164 RepID=UPI00155513EB|nr:EVE domain-containing protein [Pseudoruegeria sp. HB172150]
MAQSFFIGVVHERQAAMARKAGIVAFSHGREAPVKSLSVGDAVILYAPKTDFDGKPVQAFIAHATVTGEEAEQREFAPGMIAWCRAARFDDVNTVPVRPLLDDLGFIRNKQHWGMAFRQGKFAIPDPDYRLIASAMGLTA